MPILAFAPASPVLGPMYDGAVHRTFVEVSRAAQIVIDPLLLQSNGQLDRQHLDLLLELLRVRDFDAELQVLIAAIDRNGQVDAQFL